MLEPHKRYGTHMQQHDPHMPGPTLSDAGSGRLLRGRRQITILERLDGTTWTEVGRFGSELDAGVALDEAVAAGRDPETLRLTEVGPTTMSRVVTVAGLALGAALAVFVLYVFFGG